MPIWTIVGLYEDSGETFADEAQGDTAYDAMGTFARACHTLDLLVLGAVGGGGAFYPACEESGRAATVADLRDCDTSHAIADNERLERWRATP